MAKQEIKVFAEEPRRFLIVRVVAPFNKGKEAVEKAKSGRFRVPALWVNQQTREERGYKDDVSTNGNWVKEGILYRGDKRIITPTGLCYLHADEAVKAHFEGREYTLEGCTQDEIAKAEAEGLEIKASDLNRNEDLVIPCRNFGSDRYGLFLFGGTGTDEERSKRAEKSGEWLINALQKINEVVLYLHIQYYSKDIQYYSKSVGKDYATQMWLGSLDGRSLLDGYGLWDRGLRYGARVLGVLDSAEGASQKN